MTAGELLAGLVAAVIAVAAFVIESLRRRRAAEAKFRAGSAIDSGVDHGPLDVSHLGVKIELASAIPNPAAPPEPDPSLAFPSKHHWARSVIVEAFERVFGRAPTLPEAQIAQGIALLETSYGRGWKKDGPGHGSHNWGAVQGGRPPCPPAESFIHGDTHADGTGYQWCYRKYKDDVSGAAHMIKLAFKPAALAAASRGDTNGVSAAMRKARYFEAPLDRHQKRLRETRAIIAKALGEPIPGPTGGGLGAAAVLAVVAGGGIFLLSKAVS